MAAVQAERHRLKGLLAQRANLSIYLSIYLYNYLSISIYLYNYLSIYLSIYLTSIYLSIYLHRVLLRMCACCSSNTSNIMPANPRQIGFSLMGLVYRV